jgi:hypothetical protein
VWGCFGNGVEWCGAVKLWIPHDAEIVLAAACDHSQSANQDKGMGLWNLPIRP